MDLNPVGIRGRSGTKHVAAKLAKINLCSNSPIQAAAREVLN
jgi:hypothetical protein